MVLTELDGMGWDGMVWGGMGWDWIGLDVDTVECY